MDMLRDALKSHKLGTIYQFISLAGTSNKEVGTRELKNMMTVPNAQSLYEITGSNNLKVVKYFRDSVVGDSPENARTLDSPLNFSFKFC